MSFESKKQQNILGKKALKDRSAKTDFKAPEKIVPLRDADFRQREKRKHNGA